jgi:hypothetical protein
VFAAEWSRLEGAEVIRVRGVASFTVRPSHSAAGLPGMLGTIVEDGDTTVFVPRYPFVAGMSYVISAAGGSVVLEQSTVVTASEASVVAIYPTSSVVPQNLLRIYVEFSRPMSEGYARSCIRLADVDGTLQGALLDTEYELWDSARRRLTVLLDPGRIKQGLADHEAAGYPLQVGQRFRIVVDAGFLDATGAPLVTSAERLWSVGEVLDTRVSPELWTVRASSTGLSVTFDRPLDHGLLARCLRVLDPSGTPVPGDARGEDDTWIFTPTEEWAVGEHSIRIDPVLEDVAGNSVQRVFDRPVDDDDAGAVTTSIPFIPVGPRA